MAHQSKCPKCSTGTRFEAKLAEVPVDNGSPVSVHLVRCVDCGTVVGLLDLAQMALLQQIAKK